MSELLQKNVSIKSYLNSTGTNSNEELGSDADAQASLSYYVIEPSALGFW